MGDKLYQVTYIDFSELTIEAKETDLTVSDVPESEVFPIEDFKDFRIRLTNRRGQPEIVDFGEWVEGHRNRKS